MSLPSKTVAPPEPAKAATSESASPAKASSGLARPLRAGKRVKSLKAARAAKALSPLPASCPATPVSPASPETTDSTARQLQAVPGARLAEPTSDADATSPPAGNAPVAGSSRALLVFTVSAVLLGLLDSRRLTATLERLELPGAGYAAQLVQEAASLSGATLVSDAEARLLRRVTPEWRLGEMAVAGAEPADVPQTAQSPLDPAPLSPFPAPPSAALQSATPVVSGVTPELTPAPDQPQPTAEPTPAPQTEKPRVLIVGDSLIMEGLGPALFRTLRKNADLDVIREGRYSTGLTRTDTFDWPRHLDTLIPEKKPDLVVVCLGANDFQDIILDGKRHIAGTESWNALYRERADAFLAAATRNGAEVLWLGLPIMGNESYEKRIRGLSGLQQAACEAIAPLCRFTDNTAVLADANGQYLSHITDAQGRHVRLRYKDKIHVTETGGQLLTNAVLPELERILAPRIAAHKAYLAEQAAQPQPAAPESSAPAAVQSSGP